MLDNVEKLMQQNGFKVFTRPLELNIVGIRNNTTDPFRFNDELHVFFRSYSMERYAWTDDELHWNHYRFAICTDPTCYAYYEKNDRRMDGLLVQGQYINGFKRANIEEKGGDVLLEKPRFSIRVFYQLTGNALLKPENVIAFPAGRFINAYYDVCFQPSIDRGGKKWIDKFSGGCQVFERKKDFILFIQLCAWHQHVYGNNFSYTLIDLKSPQLSAAARFNSTVVDACRSKQSSPDRQAAH